jgi:hypothetical protein
MDDPQLYSIFRKGIDSIKGGIYKIMHKEDETLEYTSSIENLGKILDKIVGKAQEMYNTPKIDRYIAAIGFTLRQLPDSYYDERDRIFRPHERLPIILTIYADKIIKCEHNKLYSPDKIICTTNDSRESFELPDSDRYIEAIKNWTQEARKLFYKEALKHSDKKYMTTTIDILTDSNALIKDNPEISKQKITEDTYKIEYKRGQFKAKITTSFW